MSLYEEIFNLYKSCLTQAPNYGEWVVNNRKWLDEQLRLIGKRHQLVWNVRESRFVEVRIV